MDNLENTPSPTGQKKTKGGIVVVLVILLVIVAVILLSRGNKAVAPVGENKVAEESDTTTSINQDLDNINLDVGSDADLNTINSDIDAL